MPFFNQVASGIDTSALLAELALNPHLWGEQAARIGAGSPHAQSKDIWLRYRDLDQYAREHGNDLSHFCDAHKSVWLSPAKRLPAGIALAESVRSIVGGELGGVLLTHLPSGAKIAPHVDHGWHAEAHHKYYVALKVRRGAEFCWEDGAIRADDGDVYWFRNDVLHWVVNDSPEERVTMIVCIKHPRVT